LDVGKRNLGSRTKRSCPAAEGGKKGTRWAGENPLPGRGGNGAAREGRGGGRQTGSDRGKRAPLEKKRKHRRRLGARGGEGSFTDLSRKRGAASRREEEGGDSGLCCSTKEGAEEKKRIRSSEKKTLLTSLKEAPSPQREEVMLDPRRNSESHEDFGKEKGWFPLAYVGKRAGTVFG